MEDNSKRPAIWQEFRQKEELTTRLRNILSDYPLGPAALQEFVQNADDAGATRVHFVWDERRHGQKSSPRCASTRFGRTRWSRRLQSPTLWVPILMAL